MFLVSVINQRLFWDSLKILLIKFIKISKMVEEFQQCEIQSKAEHVSVEPQTTVASNDHS